jgi:hypothetical protein
MNPIAPIKNIPRLIPFLIEAIKEQQIIIENQNQKIENLMTRMSALEAK